MTVNLADLVDNDRGWISRRIMSLLVWRTLNPEAVRALLESFRLACGLPMA